MSGSPKLDVNVAQVRPAYGNYTSPEGVTEAFLQGKDFRTAHAMGNQVCSIRNFNPGTLIELRYGKYYADACVVTVPEGGTKDSSKDFPPEIVL